ncbi:hypothetical protein PRUPE_4G232500 [Prunus persica]|uniref:FRIGIDA-like protein n=1 Tax=Prunus persica TaxID=3760 RepID=A0A251PPU9_PRUPE|nr:FRIGIDA-like protein 1 [Prunus persica]ONI13593.1 hypothetical protein PRUPE_4G232500 [Prunus persica]
MATTVETMSAAMELIETKKENLKKAFDELQAHYNVLSSFNLTWSDLDSHFTSIKDSLNQKLQLLQTLESQSSNPSSSIPQDPCSSNPPSQKPQDPSYSSYQIPKDPSSSSNLPTHIAEDPSLSSLTLAQITEDTKTLTQIKKDPPSSSISSTQVVKDPSSSNPPTRNTVELGTSLRSVSVPPRPELVAFCERMDAMGLRKYMNETLDNRNTIRAELLGAIRYAKDPAAMVLDAVDDFYSENGRDKGDKDPELFAVRRSGVLLLEVLMGVSPDVGFEVRERAKELALAWKGKVSMDGENPFEALGFLHLVAAYGLQSEFKMDELVDHFVIIARYRQAIELCQKIGLGDKIADLIQKLVSKGKHLLAVKFISEFDLTDKFPPVPLLKSYLKESKKLAKKVCKDGNNSRKSMNEATAKETGALKSVIKVIEDLKLQSDYPPAVLQKRLEQLEKEKANRKRHAEAPAVKPQQHKQQTAKQQKLKQQQYGNKHPRMTAPVGPAAVSNSINAAGLLPAYALSGTATPIPPYAGSSAGLYGFAGGQMGFLGNPGPASNHLYSSDHYVPSGYYNRQTAYGGYGVPPEYRPPSHYPQ